MKEILLIPSFYMDLQYISLLREALASVGLGWVGLDGPIQRPVWSFGLFRAGLLGGLALVWRGRLMQAQAGAKQARHAKRQYNQKKIFFGCKE